VFARGNAIAMIVGGVYDWQAPRETEAVTLDLDSMPDADTEVIERRIRQWRDNLSTEDQDWIRKFDENNERVTKYVAYLESWRHDPDAGIVRDAELDELLRNLARIADESGVSDEPITVYRGVTVFQVDYLPSYVDGDHARALHRG